MRVGRGGAACRIFLVSDGVGGVSWWLNSGAGSRGARFDIPWRVCLSVAPSVRAGVAPASNSAGIGQRLVYNFGCSLSRHLAPLGFRHLGMSSSGPGMTFAKLSLMCSEVVGGIRWR